MLTVTRIEGDFQAGRWEALLQALALHMGWELPSSLALRLQAHPAGAVGLALVRLVQMTFGPTALARRMLEQLQAWQGPDGSIAGDPLPTACAVAAFNAVLAERWPADLRSGAAAARERALAALAAMQDHGPPPLFMHADDRTIQERAAGTALILALLHGDEGFCRATRFADAMRWLERRRRRLDGLAALWWRQAQTGRHRPRGHSPARQAIAA